MSTIIIIFIIYLGFLELSLQQHQQQQCKQLAAFSSPVSYFRWCPLKAMRRMILRGINLMEKEIGTSLAWSLTQVQKNCTLGHWKITIIIIINDIHHLHILFMRSFTGFHCHLEELTLFVERTLKMQFSAVNKWMNGNCYLSRKKSKFVRTVSSYILFSSHFEKVVQPSSRAFLKILKSVLQ